jgi:hypothetical protein
LIICSIISRRSKSIINLVITNSAVRTVESKVTNVFSNMSTFRVSGFLFINKEFDAVLSKLLDSEVASVSTIECLDLSKECEEIAYDVKCNSAPGMVNSGLYTRYPSPWSKFPSARSYSDEVNLFLVNRFTTKGFFLLKSDIERLFSDSYSWCSWFLVIVGNNLW